MRFPTTTGMVAPLLELSEPQLQDRIRRGIVTPPPVICHRRIWSLDDVLVAAKELGIDSDRIRALAGGASLYQKGDGNG